MESVKDYLEKLEINNNILNKQLSDVNISKVTYFKEERLIYIYLSSKNIISYDYIELFRNELKQRLDYFRDIKVKIRYIKLEKQKTKDIIKKYWNNIVHILTVLCPSLNGWVKGIEYMCIDDTLKIKIPSDLFYKRLMKQNAIQVLKNVLSEEAGIDIDIIFEKSINKGPDVDKLIERNDSLVEAMVKERISENIILDEDEEVNENKAIEIVSKEEYVYGENVNAPVEKINRLNQNSGTVCIVGEVFDVELKELRNGKVLLIAAVTDYTSSINCKLFLNDMNKDKVIDSVTKGSYLKIKGDALYDNYQRELTMTISGIKEEKKEERIDTSDEKRVELHAHTQMSSMDAICPTKKLVERAAKWGHPAIAITDHGVVQAFPEAMDAAKKHGIKVIYGVEGYLAEDEVPIVKDPNKKGLDQTFVVFDIETTGFSNTNDKITEIGAVKIESFKVVDRFSELVNPEVDISYKIQELTGITNDLVSDKPTIEEILPKFLEFVGDSVLVAHNAEFDMGFISQKSREQGLEFKNKSVDTLTLARVLLPHLKRHRLNVIAKDLGIPLLNHHRAVDDAEATAHIFIKFLEMLKKQGVEVLSDVNEKLGGLDYTKIATNHITLLAKNYIGLKNLYKIVSDAHVNHFYRAPRILRSVLEKYKEGLIIGSACEAGQVFNAVKKNVTDEEMEKIIDLYDYIEVMPIDNNRFMIEKGEVKDEEELRYLNRRLIEVAKKFGKLPVATGDVHFLDKHEAVLRKVLKYSQGFKVDEEETYLHFRTTNEMLDEFSYLDPITAYEVVVANTNKIADMIDSIKPIPDDTYPPVIEGSDVELREMCYAKAKRIYGDPMPDVVKSRLDRELNSIIGNGYAVMYIISQKLVTKSLKDGYLVGSRGSVGSSFAATMSDITEVNPLPAHYICENEECKYSYFYEIGEWGSGADLPDKDCPKCGRPLKKDGHDIPFEVFLGFEGDKEPDIDLNFSGEYQPVIHKYTEELFGEGYVYRAGTIGTVAEKTAFGYARKYIEENNINTTSAEALRLANGCTGVKRTSGQHPGGVMVVPHYKDVYDFTPIQYPANDTSCGVITTHFDYHSISGRILKLDILGHDVPTIIRMLEDITGIDATTIPLDDKETMSLFTSTDALGVTPEEINCPIGSLAIPEFGTKFVRQMLLDTKPTTFAELVRISGLSHGTDVWLNNAQELVQKEIVGLKDVISTRDDIMNYLIFKGLPPKMAFTIMESVRKGRGLKPEHIKEMEANDVPEWYIWSCQQIKYMFPKAHAVAYVMMSFRLAYCKVHYPEAFYATYFTTKAEDFDADLIVKGLPAIKSKIKEIEELGNDATTKEKNMLTVLEVALEMYARDIKIIPVDIYKSDAKTFQVVGEKKLLPPMIALQGVGENAAINIQKERENGEFISKEDLRKRTKISKTVIETLTNHGSLENMSDENQLSLF
ncbi:DNA polymerase III PolC-type (PolIII([[Clostridium] sordellii]|uniref:DNA polymerase III PolC-type n=1 Tax=Paraclostridium sordellii TaxID=1505 RepID=A0ABP1XPZ2_PARSO|nr:PolC-type DNA polymerase III [Paeniclostridium sordellii]CEJ72785.1 DNA polymerase III PolC-type (PolIII) [[Clostridium] sordellii] [Paeniclostridium sordellii]CEN68338.1 DNA polymerase III PolC-type (PolIII) [[Clostridium] sordellii] [Paeniclostridium sordellii]CEN71605.1 DNA polymerase III PolC-type (PolIII) [[Clostridium] sordellii] [Paeniclostridium sordellii]CEO21874.1 DNA polymerase III PolC-type (PolIII) [[Clostridium] sordellii] [Paeniclostridium sordellii]CEP76802.1 DNA polymerase 